MRGTIKAALAALVAAALMLTVSSCRTVEPDTRVHYPVLTNRTAGETLFSMKEWTGETVNGVEQTKVFEVNETAHHSDETLVYGSVENARLGAMNYDYSKSEYYQLLTGENKKWSLAVYENVADAQAAGVYGAFYKKDYNMSRAPKYEGDGQVKAYKNAYYGGFREVTLPASWQTQGFDFPIYSNMAYPWNTYKNGDVQQPLAPTQTNPVTTTMSTGK